MTQFLRAGTFDPTPVITHRMPLEAFDEAMRLIQAGDAGKIVFEIS
jgi:threonine 3-dehydrogenase